jgi:tRNA pseudouridine55 synthase
MTHRANGKTGVINLYKPPDITSHKAAKKVQTILGANKAGHTGTLDPFAEGILLVCLNEATRIAEYLVTLDKEYVVQVQFGIATDTHDITGKVLKTCSVGNITLEDVRRTLTTFLGEIQQEPPLYSAVKVKGVPLYKLARKGLTAERRKRVVSIYEIDIIDFSLPHLLFRMRCSKGTYVRSLVSDLGSDLQTGAIVKALKRTSIGHFAEESASTFDDMESERFRLYTMDEALSHLDDLKLQKQQYDLARHGTGFFTKDEFKPGQIIKLRSPSGKLFGMGKMKAKGLVKIDKVFFPVE